MFPVDCQILRAGAKTERCDACDDFQKKIENTRLMVEGKMANLIDDPEIEKMVLSAVAKRTREAQNFRIVSLQKKFLDGSLFTVAFEGPPDAKTDKSQSFINRVYVRGKQLDVYGHDEALLNVVGATHSRSYMSMFGETKIVSGIIATLMTILIITISGTNLLRGTGFTLPEAISSAWLIIVGFYFGKLGNHVE